MVFSACNPYWNASCLTSESDVVLHAVRGRESSKSSKCSQSAIELSWRLDLPLIIDTLILGIEPEIDPDRQIRAIPAITIRPKYVMRIGLHRSMKMVSNGGLAVRFDSSTSYMSTCQTPKSPPAEPFVELTTTLPEPPN